MVVDIHAHIIVPEMLRQAGSDDTWRPSVFWQGGKQVIDFGEKQIRSAIREFVDIELILEAQVKAGVNCVVLSPWVSLLNYSEAPEDGLRLSRLQNEALGRIAERYRDQVRVLGTVPLQSPELAAIEVSNLMQIPGMVGVEVAASVNSDYLGHERFRPFWEAAENAGAVVFIHPTTRGFDLPIFNEFYLWNSVGNPMETTITSAHMVMSGLMEAHPQLKVVLAHGGGSLLALKGRLCHAHTFQPQAQSKLRESPGESIKRFYFDTLTHDVDLLRALIEFVGADHVLLGSDYPFDMGDENPAVLVRSVKLDQASELKILSENAKALFGFN